MNPIFDIYENQNDMNELFYTKDIDLSPSFDNNVLANDPFGRLK